MVTGVWVWSSERSVSRAELTLHWVCAAGSYSSPWRGGSPGEGGQGYRRVGWLPTFTQETELHLAPTSAHLLPSSPCMFAAFPEVGGVASV